MSDRLQETQRRRTAGATPVRHRPQGHQPPLAALQAKAGNRAVASVIQRATGTGQLLAPPDPQQSTAPVEDDLAITPVVEPEQRGRETRQGDDAKAKQPAGKTKAEQQTAKEAKAKQEEAEAEVERHKEAAADAAGNRAGAAEKARTASGAVIGAHKKATAARNDLQTFTRRAESEDAARGESLEAERQHRVTVRTATREQNEADGRAQSQQGAENTARKKAAAAEKAVKKYTKQAEKAEAEQEAAERDVEKYTQQVEEAEAKQEAAQKQADEFKGKAREAEQKVEAAREAAQQKAAAEDQAQQQAAKAEAEAEEQAETAKKMEKWAGEAAAALEQAALAETEAGGHGTDAETAGHARMEAGLRAEKWEDLAGEAREGAKQAEEVRQSRTEEADAAAKARAQAEQDAARHAGDALQAAKDAGEARRRAEEQKATAEWARAGAKTASGRIQRHSEAASRARDEVAAAAQERTEAGTTGAEAKTAWTGAKAAADEARKTTEAAEQAEASAAKSQKSGGSTRERLKKPFSATRAKQRIDGPDTVILRGSAPVGGPVRAEAAQDGNDELLRATAQQGQVETGVNVVNSGLGIFNDARDVKAGLAGRKGKGIQSRQDRKKLHSKSAGLTQNTLMGVNDGTKIADNLVRNTENLSGVAPLGATGGILTMSFSLLIAIRDGLVIKDTYDKRKKLKEHFAGVAAARTRGLQAVLDGLGTATDDLTQACSRLSGPESDWDEGALQAVQKQRDDIETFRGELLAHLAAVRDYAVDKQERRLRKRAADLTGNAARTAAGAVAIAAAAGAVSGGIGAGVAGGVAAAALGGLAAHKGGKKANKRYQSVRHPDKHARPTVAQEGTEETESTEPKKSKDGKGGRKRDATAEAFKVTKSIKQGKRQFNAQELYAIAAGPAVPVGANVPDDIRRSAREFLKDLKCDPAKYGWTEEQWEASLNDPDQQAEWEGEIAKQLASA
ncbi:hypothetical protein ACFUCH_21930 [Streptomyces olivaceus]|uniref:hypothetical protein n=1 Tax=Streptomyces olivaceus TaxID=47716 RepID=UPI0018A81673|nr:hypothetical protein [Streptomyces olivaceus]MBF8175965.1 hypothetical protein [Streptomyces olivaceus]